ncbi:hypothetical protein N9E91_04110 [Alphaproteobacteria bacterium]|nr:hypothetical protein [Alphaproteobacteria bacterium]
MKIPWQKTYRKLPSPIGVKITNPTDEKWIVGASKVLPYSDIEKGIYEHLGIKIENGNVIFPDSIVPDMAVGKSSSLNVNGKEITRCDLPKVPKTFSFEAPNYGDFSKGTHDVSFTRDCYQRELIPPKIQFDNHKAAINWRIRSDISVQS